MCEYSLAVLELGLVGKNRFTRDKVLRVANVVSDKLNNTNNCLSLPCQYLYLFSKEIGVELVFIKVKNETEAVELLDNNQADLAIIFSLRVEASILSGRKKEFLIKRTPLFVSDFSQSEPVMGAEHAYTTAMYQQHREKWVVVDQLAVISHLGGDGEWHILTAYGEYSDFILMFNTFLKNMSPHIKQHAIKKMNQALYPPSLIDLFYTYRLFIIIILLMMVFILLLFYKEKRQAQMARRKEQEKAQFMAIVSHELRNPINTMIGALELLQKQVLSAEKKQLVSLTNNASRQILNTLNDLLVFSKLDQKKMILDPRFVCLFDAVNECIVNYRWEANKKNITIAFNANDLIGKEVEVDIVRFIQVLSNLLSNSIKFTVSGSVSVHLELSQLPELGWQLEVSVQDTGIGIALDQQEILFKPFTQALSNTLVHFGGAGLGLAICKQLLELMQGEIKLSSVLGMGTHIRFYLPVRVRPMEKKEQVDIKFKNFLGAYILIVEDHPSNQIVLGKQLQSLACTVRMAGNGIQAVNLVKKNKFDLILLDCYLPDITGYEVALQIRTFEGEERHTPIIALSGATDSAHLERCMASKMDGVLFKPLLLSQLVVIMEQWIDSPHPASSSIQPLIDTNINLADLFIRSSQEDYLLCRNALAVQDLPLAHYYAHRICGAARTMGMNEIATAAQRLEEKLIAPVHSSYPALTLLLQQLGQVLDQH